MTKRKEWEKLLKQQLEQDESSLIKLIRKNSEGNIIDLGNDLNNLKIMRHYKCHFICKCGNEHTRDVRNCCDDSYKYKVGFLCVICTKKGKSDKISKARTLDRSYEECSIFAQNIVWPWAESNRYDKLAFDELWKKFVENHPEYFNINSADRYPVSPATYYIQNIKPLENDYKWSWSDFFGIIRETPSQIKEKKILEMRMELIKNTNLKQNKDDLLCPGIYLYIFPDGKKYVGQTRGTILSRCVEGHLRDAFNGLDICTRLDRKTRSLIKKTNDNKYPVEWDEWIDIFFKKVQVIVLEVIKQRYYTDTAYFKLLDERECHFIDEYKTFFSSKKYDGKMGLNCIPGNIGTEMYRRNENNCYDHNGNRLPRGIDSIKKRDKIEGYTSRRTIDRSYSISIGKKYKDKTLDEKLKIALEFQNLKFYSLEGVNRIVDEFYTKHNLIIDKRKQKNKKSKEKVGHNGKNLTTGLFYNSKEKYYRINVNRQNVVTGFKFECNDFASQEEQLKTAKFYLNELSNTNLDSDSLINKTYDELTKYIKENKYPIICNIDARSTWYKLLIKIQKYENPETKQEIIDEHNRLLEWHPAPDLEGWERQWYKNRNFRYQNQYGIVCSKKTAIKHLKDELPNFDEIVKSYECGLSYNEFKAKISKHIWKRTLGWLPHLKKAYKDYKKFNNYYYDKHTRIWKYPT
jgi:hypothetical protein